MCQLLGMNCNVPTDVMFSFAERAQRVPQIARHGTFNFLLSNGEALWAHASTHLCYALRQHPFGSATLRDEDLSVDFAQHAAPGDRVAVVVTTPLTTDEQWTTIAPGELKVFVDGMVAA
jgi:glutamine amidotransferase